MRLYCWAAAIVLATAQILAAEAGELNSSNTRPSASDWTVTVGAETRFEPSFDGASRNLFWPYPLLDVRRAGTPEHFRAPRDGLGIGILDMGKLEVGPVGQYRWSRKEADEGALRGLGNVNWAGEVGGFADYWWAPWLRLRAEVRQGFAGHRGVISDLTGDIVLPVDGKLTVSGGPRATFATAGAANPYFGVSPSQSMTSGLPVYNVRIGLHSIGAGAQLRYQWSPELATHVFVELERLTGNAAHSPLVTQRGSPDQLTLGVGVTRSFDFKQFW